MWDVPNRKEPLCDMYLELRWAQTSKTLIIVMLVTFRDTDDNQIKGKVLGRRNNSHNVDIPSAGN